MKQIVVDLTFVFFIRLRKGNVCQSAPDFNDGFHFEHFLKSFEATLSTNDTLAV